jgi:3,4-dihydroxy-2-butanone 4-phosphate synthase
MNEIIEQAIRELSLGKFVLVYDLDGREEEVDLVCF